MGSVEFEAPQSQVDAFLRTIAGEANASGLPRNSSSLALEASRLVKAGAGWLYGLQCLSTKGVAQFVLLFDTTSAAVPANGATPVAAFTVAASGNLPVTWVPGRWFEQGIWVANSSTSSTLTLGAADCFFDCQYI